MPSQVSSAGPSPEPPGFRWSWLVLAGTILAGCALGGAVMGVANVSGNGEPGTQARPTVAAADPGAGVEGDAAAGDETGEAGLYVRVPESCVQTAEDARTLAEHVDRVVAAVADLEPERLRQTVERRAAGPERDRGHGGPVSSPGSAAAAGRRGGGG